MRSFEQFLQDLNMIRFIEHSPKLIQGVVDILNSGKVNGVEQSSSVGDFTNLTHVAKGGESAYGFARPGLIGWLSRSTNCGETRQSHVGGR